MTVQQAFDLAFEHHHAGRLAEAEHLYRQVLAAVPQHPDALHLLGVIASQAGRPDAAADLIRQAIALLPGAGMYHCNLGFALRKLGRAAEAIEALQRSLALQPDFAEAHNNLGLALHDLGRLDEAAACYRQAIRCKPDCAEAHNNLGDALQRQGSIPAAIAAYRAAIAFQPDFADAHSNLGTALADEHRLDEAIAEYDTALRLRPDSAEAHYNLGNALRFKGRQDESLAAYRRALELRPGFVGALNNMGNIFRDRGDVEEALATYRTILRSAPGEVKVHSNVLLTLHCQTGGDPGAIFAEHRRWDEMHAQPLERLIVPHTNAPEPARRLRIGYVSPDFREHSVAFFLENLLALHDPAQVETFCYEDVARPDAFTERLRGIAGHWRKIRGLTDAQSAELIRRDGIDILVDLAGHTADSRLTIFACKPAPVQVAWLGYCGTTGMRTMDYRLTDAFCDPPGTTDHLHTETLIRLPQCAWCFRPFDAVPPASAPPAAAAGHVTFGSFNAMPKITDAMLAVWSRILREVPGSRLLLKNLGLGGTEVKARVRARIERAGIAPERIELRGNTPSVAGHLALYGQVDIALDTFPYHGTTTTCEALWMGVPVVSLAGKTHASRVGVSLLTNAGLPEGIANSEEHYSELAANLANDLPRLTHHRRTLRQQMQESPLMDAPRFARDVEQAYRRMWREWCARGN